VPAEDVEGVNLDATLVQTPIQIAEAIIFNHPDLLTIRADVAATVIYDHISLALKQDDTLPQYISAHGSGASDPYYTITVATNPQTGEVITPITTDDSGNPIVDKNGKPIQWPQQNGQSVIQQYTLSAGVVGTTDGTQQGALFSALAAVLRSTKDDPSLNGQSWSTQHGITAVQRTNVQPASPPHDSRARLASPSRPAGTLVADSEYLWALSGKTSMYGLDLDSSSLTYGASSQSLSFNVKNWADRYLGAYVQFFDEDANAINSPPTYLSNISPGNTLAGIPIWTDYTTLTFQMPSNATKADVLLGGMGVDNLNADVDVVGIVFTGLFNYAVPTFLIGLSVGTTGARLALKNLEDTAITVVVTAVKAFLGTPVAIIGAMSNPKKLIATFGEIAIGVIFSVGLPKLATAITGYVTATEILEKAPTVGWAFQVASCAAGIADMLATTIEVLSSPATYTIEITRVIDLQVNVSPDPTHGTSTQAAIWPQEANKWELVVQYQGGTSIKQTGRMSSVTPSGVLSVLFSGDTAISAAPGAQIQVTANIYSVTNWLCGRWSSAWVAAAAHDGSTTLTLQGAIIEYLVPLTTQSQYFHYQKLVYQGGQHAWQQTFFPPSNVWSGSYDCPGSGNTLCRLVDITMNDLAYTLGYAYQASGQDLPLDFGTGNQNGQMYAFQSISVLGNPASGMKQPTIGFSLQPSIAYDQFGPAPLFTLSAATCQPELDAANNQSVPSDIVTAFANAGSGPASGSKSPGTGTGNFTLPANAVVTVVTKTAEWYIGPPNQPMYDLRRQTDTIGVFAYPTASFSPRNYYLDSRSYASEQKYYLRQVSLSDGNGTFDYTTGTSWGAFAGTTLDDVVVHPNGYVIGVNYEYHKMLILQLPDSSTSDADAPVAVPFSGKGLREGLLQGPVALSVTPDGRILVLEQDNARIQAFDTMANPVQCFAGPFAFTVDAAFTSDLNSSQISGPFLQAYQQHVQPSLASRFSLPVTSAADLNAGMLTAGIRQEFADNALPLSESGPFQILTTRKDSIWLLVDHGSGLSFDIRRNLYVTLKGQELFTLPAIFATDLDLGNATPTLRQAFADYGITLSANELAVFVVTPGAEWGLYDQVANVSYTITTESMAYVYDGSSLLFSLPAGVIGEFGGSSAPPADLIAQFTSNGITLSSSLQLTVIAPGSSWQLVDEGNKVTYSIEMEPNLDVFHAPSFDVEVAAPSMEWVLRDKVNTLSFAVTPDANNPTLLDVQQLIATMPLKDGASADVTYLDVGVETKGFIYVLSYQGTGSDSADYHLDIYNPNGVWLSRTPSSSDYSGVNGARIVVDQWRNLYTLNYETILGPNNRTEPSVSIWIPLEEAP
jgi:hypothetical protein